MLYGEVDRKTKYMGGQAVKQIVIYSESVQISAVTEALVAFQGLLDQYSRGELSDPGVQIITHPDTGKPKRMVKVWSVG